MNVGEWWNLADDNKKKSLNRRRDASRKQINLMNGTKDKAGAESSTLHQIRSNDQPFWRFFFFFFCSTN